MLRLTHDILEATGETKMCPLCGDSMSVRENTTTFWEKQKERYAYHCNNSNCLHKIPLCQSDIDVLRVEQSLLKWEIDLEMIENEILERYELKELLNCLRRTAQYLRKGEGNLSAKDYFLQELKNPGGKKKYPWKLKAVVIPLALLALTLGTLAFMAPHVGPMMEASILSLIH